MTSFAPTNAPSTKQLRVPFYSPRSPPVNYKIKRSPGPPKTSPLPHGSRQPEVRLCALFRRRADAKVLFATRAKNAAPMTQAFAEPSCSSSASQSNRYSSNQAAVNPAAHATPRPFLPAFENGTAVPQDSSQKYYSFKNASTLSRNGPHCNPNDKFEGKHGHIVYSGRNDRSMRGGLFGVSSCRYPSRCSAALAVWRSRSLIGSAETAPRRCTAKSEPSN